MNMKVRTTETKIGHVIHERKQGEEDSYKIININVNIDCIENVEMGKERHMKWDSNVKTENKLTLTKIPNI